MKIENNIFDSKLLEQLKIQPVGGGVIDMICPLSDIWFSEIPMDAPIALKDNEAYRDFLKKTWPCENEHRDCYWPGFWL